MKYYYFYKTINLISGKYYYGVHQTSNLQDGYLGSGKLLLRAIEKYGRINFTKRILKFFPNELDMFEYEKMMVTVDIVESDQTYNLICGGKGGYDFINRMGINNKGKCKTLLRDSMNFKMETDEIFRARICKIRSENMKNLHKEGKITVPNWKGRKHKNSTKRKIGEKNSIKQKGKNNSQYGTCWIYSLEEKVSKKVSRDELSYWLKIGWIKGRKIKF